MVNLCNLYYTNTITLQHNIKSPKIVVVEDALINENIDLVSISEVGLY